MKIQTEHVNELVTGSGLVQSNLDLLENRAGILALVRFSVTNSRQVYWNHFLLALQVDTWTPFNNVKFIAVVAVNNSLK